MKHNSFLEGRLWKGVMSVQDVVGSEVLLNYLQETHRHIASQENESHTAIGLSRCYSIVYIRFSVLYFSLASDSPTKIPNESYEKLNIWTLRKLEKQVCGY